ncbi:protein TolQ [Pseudothauera rhizosphaerae]|uniref:Protein TolQ n=1 Tax=Pseudothauera rhizosphaerae TaxID=2565932 RepID=A0A4S4B398_9RHOO|nr:protein TolQ [Pseudothauera rhizosphaerae]THF65381.1 protein TolQ [Pseudothauera rhizosphaerae]
MSAPLPSSPLSIWSLVADASPLVQAVMLILLLASVASWAVIFLRGAVLRRAYGRQRACLEDFRRHADPVALHRTPPSAWQARPAADEDGLPRIFHAGCAAFMHQLESGEDDAEIVLDDVDRALHVAIAEEQERLEQGLSFLATVGSVSPYIGLFGTVWGIMNAFIGLSQVQQVSINTVAPGIAEALVATAIGLFAAIPAVMAYNRLSARVRALSARFEAFASELETRLHRHLRRHGGTAPGSTAVPASGLPI